MADNKAKQILWPANPKIVLRCISLYVGQGTSTLLLIRNASDYLSLLVDINLDEANDGTDVPAMMADLLEKNTLDVFVNTHPHGDHLKGISGLQKATGINEVWHSGHKPGRKHDDAYKELQSVIKEVKDSGGSEVQLNGSRDENMIGEVRYYVLAPAEYVVEDVEGEDADTRYNRIHEQCAVLRFGVAETWVMLPGDADRDAFEKHITDYHKERLDSAFLVASHHGSRTFFRYKEEDEPYLNALNAIDPAAVAISAPRQKESKHDHPHEDAVELYKDKVGDNLFHTGENRHCFIFDIFEDGTTSDVMNDNGELAKSYPIDSGDNDDKAKKSGYSKREQVTAIAGARYAE